MYGDYPKKESKIEVRKFLYIYVNNSKLTNFDYKLQAEFNHIVLIIQCNSTVYRHHDAYLKTSPKPAQFYYVTSWLGIAKPKNLNAFRSTINPSTKLI